MKPAAALLACAACAVLAACNNDTEVDVRNASVEEVANQVANARAGEDFVRPGKWQSKVTIEEMSMPGVPAEMAENMKRMMAEHQQRTSEQCLTEEEAKRPREDFFAGKDNNCRYDHFTMGGGKIDARMRCAGPGGISQVMERAGTYAPDRYQMRMATRTEGSGAPGMVMKLKVDSTRIGDCDAKAA